MDHDRFDMQKTPENRSWLIGIHLLFWLLIVTVTYFVYYRILFDVGMALTASGISLLSLLLLVYGHLFFLLPHFYNQQKYGAYAFGLILLLFCSATFRFFLAWWVVRLNAWPIEDQFDPSLLGSMVFGGVFILMLSLPLRLIYNWFKKQELEQALKTHQLEAELRFLKAQVNPHFLFNALNNIYALSFTESKQAPSMILKLSEMMSYMLYDCKSELVPLQSEINYLHNFLALQQLKKEGEMQVEFLVSEDIPPQQITPMLFIPFFENAFKHGNLEDVRRGWLKAELNCSVEQLQFNISNSYLEQEMSATVKGGVGLTNIRQRLNLLYPNKHRLTLRRSQGVFTAQLQLELPS